MGSPARLLMTQDWSIWPTSKRAYPPAGLHRSASWHSSPGLLSPLWPPLARSASPPSVATVVTVLNTLAISLVTSGLGIIQSLFFGPRPKGIGPATLRTVRAAVEEARWVFGERRVGGALVGYHVNTPDTNDVDENGNVLVYPNADNYLHLCFVLSEGQCESLDGMWIDGEFFALVWKDSAPSPQAGWNAGHGRR